MNTFRKAGLALGVAALPLLGAGIARAADPATGFAGWFAAPPVMVVMPPAPAAAVQADPAFEAIRTIDAMMNDMDGPGGVFARMVAQQTAVMSQMMGQMNTAMQVGMPGMGATGGCAQMVTISYDGRDAQPQVTVRRIGSGCGAPPQTEISAPAQAAPADTAPIPGPERPRLLQVDQRKPLPARPIYRG